MLTSRAVTSTALVVALACVFVAPVGTARGQEVQMLNLEQTAQARALFEEGLTLAAQKQWAVAADRFRRSNTLRESAVVIFNLAASLQELGRIVEAAELLRQLETAPSANAETRSAARESLARAQPRIGKLTVIVDGNATGTVITLDGKPLQPVVLGVAIPADPGTHQLSAMRGNTSVATTTVTLAGGAAEIAHLHIPLEVGSRQLGRDELDRRSASASERDNDERAHGRPIYKQLWFWTAVTGVVVSSVAAVLFVTGNASHRASTLP